MGNLESRLREKYANEAKQRARNEAKCIVRELAEVASWFMVDKFWFLDEVMKEIEKIRKGNYCPNCGAKLESEE